MNQAARRRSLLSFGLRELLIFMLVVGALLGLVGRRLERARQQRAILTKIEAAGGRVEVDIDNYEWHQPSWWNLLVDPNLLDHVDFVSFGPFSYFSRIEDNDLAPLAQLKNLNEFWIIGHYAEVSDLTPFAELKNLQVLHVADTQVSDLSPLAQLKNLRVLWVYDTQVSDLAPLSELKNLEELDVRGTQVSDLAPLAQLKNLKWLDVLNTQVSDQQIQQLQDALPNCRIYR